MAKSPRADAPYRNQILRELSRRTLDRLAPRHVELPLNKILYEAGAPVEHLYFPERGVLSAVAHMNNRTRIEIGTIGREGMAGSMLLLDVKTVPYQYFVQVAGSGYRVEASAFTSAADGDEALRSIVLRYEATLHVQTMQGMACNGLHDIEQRCCRWILMTRDRVDSDEIKLTHEFLGLMLGVRRSSVSEILAPLQELSLLTSARGTITILNREAIEQRVCECYWVMARRDKES